MAVKIVGNSSGRIAEVADGSVSDYLQVTLPKPAVDPDIVGAVITVSENDPGGITGSPYLLSPETDADFRLRASLDCIFEDETFNYTAQNTGKHNNQNTTMTLVYGTGGLLTNGSSITTTTTGVSLATYAMFPFFSSGVQQYIQFEGSISAQPVANTIIDAGVFHRPTSNPYAPTDGAYFRINSSGVFGVINHNGTEATSSVFSFTYTNNRVYRFLIIAGNEQTEFWIDDVLYATIDTPVGQGQPFMSAALPFAMRHVITGGAAGGVLQFTLRGYGISYGGNNFIRNQREMNNGIFGSYQGLSGGTMGSLASYANSANPTAAVPTNTTSTILTALGGQGWETDTLAITTDGIIMSYQVPAGTVSVIGKRLKIAGVTIDSYIQTALTGGGYVAQYALCFGHTALSLATGEAATTKAPRRVPLGVQTVASAAVALTQLARVTQQFSNPVYVNPGEFVAIAKKKVGTAPSAGVVAHVITLDYSRE